MFNWLVVSLAVVCWFLCLFLFGCSLVYASARQVVRRFVCVSVSARLLHRVCLLVCVLVCVRDGSFVCLVSC